MARHFLRLTDLSPDEARHVIDRAIALKQAPDPGYRPFVGKTLAMIFMKSSTRTRVSFEAGMARFGGHALFLQPGATQLGRDEPIPDTAKVLSRMCSAIMVRNDSQADLEELAAHATVPVINGLSDIQHPCQLLADMQCWIEHRGDPTGKTAAWVGDGHNNVCHSWIDAARSFGFKLRIATPAGYAPDAALISEAGDIVELCAPEQATDGADLVVTDTWTSMGQEAQMQQRLRDFTPFQVTPALMARAKPDAIFMHCLPAHRGEEVAAEVIDGPQSVVWDEAENRMWSQMALLEFLLK